MTSIYGVRYVHCVTVFSVEGRERLYVSISLSNGLEMTVDCVVRAIGKYMCCLYGGEGSLWLQRRPEIPCIAWRTLYQIPLDSRSNHRPLPRNPYNRYPFCFLSLGSGSTSTARSSVCTWTQLAHTWSRRSSTWTKKWTKTGDCLSWTTRTGSTG